MVSQEFKDRMVNLFNKEGDEYYEEGFMDGSFEGDYIENKSGDN